MARKLEQFPTAASQRYPWHEWLDGSVWQLEKGEDYSSRTETLIANAREQARRLGGRLRTRRLHGEGGREGIVVQFLRP